MYFLGVDTVFLVECLGQEWEVVCTAVVGYEDSVLTPVDEDGKIPKSSSMLTGRESLLVGSFLQQGDEILWQLQ